MGQDIHQMIYLKLKGQDKYINAHEICEWCSGDGGMFAELYPDRNYSLFSLMGSGRAEGLGCLRNAVYGMPGFLAGSEFETYCRDSGYYGFIWFTAARMLDAVNKKLDYICRPDLASALLEEGEDPGAGFYDKCERMIKDGSIQNAKDFIQEYRARLDEYSHYIDFLNRCRDMLETYTDSPEYILKTYSRMDLPETVFLFFFDS